jgi:hypothetical protein
MITSGFDRLRELRVTRRLTDADVAEHMPNWKGKFVCPEWTDV